MKLADRMQALKWLTDRYTSFNPEQQARIDKYKAEVQRMNGEPEEIEDLTEIDEVIYGGSD